MTRKSKREIERALEDLGDRSGAVESPSELTDEQRDAVRASLRYRRQAYPDGDAPTGRALFQEALDHVDDCHAARLEALLAHTGRSE